MDKREIYIDLCILVIATCIGLLIVILYNNTWTQLLFVVIEVLTLLYIGFTHKHGNNIYYCMQCGQKVKPGLIADMANFTLDNGDKIFKCKKCKKKVNFRRYDPSKPMETAKKEEVPVEDNKEQ